MALKAAPADQALLLDLQSLDTRLSQLSHRASRLPEIAALTALGADRDALTRTLAEQTGAWEDAQSELKRTESDVAVVEARVARDRERLGSSSSVKDVAALEQELAALAKRQSDLEDIELAVMDTVEERAAALADTRGALAELDDQVAEASAARDAALVLLDAERAQAEVDRAALVERIPAELLALYEKQRARYGIGASHLRGGVSSASGVALNSNDMRTVRSAAPDDVLLCPDSSAILVRTDESGI